MYNGIKVLLIFCLIFGITCTKKAKHHCKYILNIHVCKDQESLKESTCGFNTIHYRKFINACDQTYYNCIIEYHGHKDVYDPADLAKCEKYAKCDTKCKPKYKPYCGNNGKDAKTFGNYCFYKAGSCMGKWKLVGRKRCNEIQDPTPCNNIPETNIKS